MLKRRLQLGGGLLALGVVALFAGHPAPVRGGHNLESHQYKDSRKCLLTAAAFGCSGGGKRTVVVGSKRHADKRQHGGGGGGGGVEGGGDGVSGGGGDRDNDLDQNGNFDYNYDDGGGGGGGGGDGGVGGGYGAEGSPETIDYYDPPLITDPRDRMLPVIYNPRPMYAPQPPPLVPQHHSQQQQPPSPYNRYSDEVPPISAFEVPIIGE